MEQPIKLALADGGEVVFNTSLTGYQEILTDPSYRGQIVTMTYPQIGNYGINAEDIESTNRRPQVAGFIVKELSARVSNFRATESLHEYLARANIMGLTGIDTRAPGAAHPRARRDERRDEHRGPRRRRAGHPRPRPAQHGRAGPGPGSDAREALLLARAVHQPLRPGPPGRAGPPPTSSRSTTA
jgi:hypothetical protein